MGVFDDRTDTEKEIESYDNWKNSSSKTDGSKSPFDVPNNYNADGGKYNPNDYYDGNLNTNLPTDNFNQSYGNIENHTNGSANNSRKSGGALGVFFIFWFIASIIAIIILSRISPAWAVIIFGQAFAVSGIFTMFSGGFKPSKIWLLLFPLLGLGCITGGLIDLYGGQELKNDFMDILPGLFSVLFFIITIGLAGFSLYSQKAKEKRCTLPVNGVVIGERVRHHKGRRLYAPVYQYTYNGVVYTKNSDIYTNYGRLKAGSQVTVFLNPLDPDDYYVKRSKISVMIILLLAFFLFLFSVFIYVYITSSAIH